MHTSRQGIAEQAKSQEKYRVRHLDGRLNAARLRDCWRDIRQDAADGVDAVSAPAYAQDVDEHSSHLVERLKRQSYRAKRVRRHDIPTGDGQRRPLGIPMVCA